MIEKFYSSAPLKSGAYSEFIRVFTDLHDHLLARRLNPAYIRLYNEASPAFQIELKAKHIDFQLSPPYIFFCNSEEL